MYVRYRYVRLALVGLWIALLGGTFGHAPALRAQASPTLRIVAPADGSTVDRPVTIRVEHTGIRFDGVQIGGNNEAGVGHWHVSIDDEFAGLSPTNVIELPNDAYPTIKAGRHRITATLNENNHAPLNPPVSQTIELNFSKDVSIPVTQGGQPSIQVIFPTANASIDAPFVARVEHSGFRMDGLNSGRDPEPGTGHWHINIDGRYAGMSVSRVLELPNDSFPTITQGQHTLTFYVHQNNHVATNPPIAASLRVNVTKELTITGTQPTTGAGATAPATQTTGATQTAARTPTTGATTAATTPTRATTAATTPTRAATATSGVTASAQTTTAIAGGGVTAEPSATVGLPGIPNTGEASLNVTLPSTIAVMCLVLGSLMLYWSGIGSLAAAPASAPSTRQRGINPVTALTQPLLRALRMVDAHPARWLAQGMERFNHHPLVARMVISARYIATARTTMAYAGGALVGISISAGVIAVHNGTTATYVATDPVRGGPVISAPLPMSPPFAQVPAGPALEPAGGPDHGAVVVAPVEAGASGTVVGPQALSLPWPSKLPNGLEFAVEDSWPFRTLNGQRPNEPFLVFRDDARSAMLRYADGDMTMRGASEPFTVGDAQGTYSQEADGSFRAFWMHAGRTIQMSGVGLTRDDVTMVAQGLEGQTLTQLQAQLRREAAHRQLPITLLWPRYLPAGINLASSESVVELGAPGTVPNADRYHLVFRGKQAVVQIGGGTDAVPAMSGAMERFEVDSVAGQLISGDRRFLLVLDSGNAEEARLHFAPLRDTQGRQLPRVQQGNVYVMAEHLDRAQFERIVAGLGALGAPEFEARARGQASSVPFLWPSELPHGFALDLDAVRYADADARLQGARAYFALNATGPDGDTIAIQGGRDVDGTSFVVPEGSDIEQIMTEVHGRGATAVRSPDGNMIVWSQGTTTYKVSSATVELDQLLAVARGLTRIDDATWQRWSATGAPTAPAPTRPVPLEHSEATTVFANAEIPALSEAVAASVDTVAAHIDTVRKPQPVAAVLPPKPERIVIPQIGLDTPIFSVDNTVPKHDVGWYQYSGRPTQGTNIVLWGHVMRWKDTPNIAAPFADVHLLNKGDRMTLVSASGEEHVYEITRQLRVTPDKVSYLGPTEHEQLLLVSCIGDKIVVNGELTKSERLLTIAEPIN
jgi:sortase (surface protein transpeptidase)